MMGRKLEQVDQWRTSIVLSAEHTEKLDQMAKRLGANRSHAMRLLIEAAHIEPAKVTINQLAQKQQA